MSAPVLAGSSPSTRQLCPVSTFHPCDSTGVPKGRPGGDPGRFSEHCRDTELCPSALAPAHLQLSGALGRSQLCSHVSPLAGPFTVLIPASQTWG